MSDTFLVTTTTTVVRRYEVKAPTARAALLPVPHLVEFPEELVSSDTQITNVIRKKKGNQCQTLKTHRNRR